MRARIRHSPHGTSLMRASVVWASRANSAQSTKTESSRHFWIQSSTMLRGCESSSCGGFPEQLGNNVPARVVITLRSSLEGGKGGFFSCLSSVSSLSFTHSFWGRVVCSTWSVWKIYQWTQQLALLYHEIVSLVTSPFYVISFLLFSYHSCCTRVTPSVSWEFEPTPIPS